MYSKEEKEGNICSRDDQEESEKHNTNKKDTSNDITYDSEINHVIQL